MGGGISMNYNGGHPGDDRRNQREALKKGMATIEKNYQTSVPARLAKAGDMAKRMALFTPTTDLDAIKDADIVIEAVFENNADQEGAVRQAGEDRQAGRDSSHQHLLSQVDEIAQTTHRVPT